METQRDKRQIYVGMKFRIDGLCSDHDQIITAITESSVVTRSLTHNKYLSRFGYKELDREGFPIHRYYKDDFLNDMNPYRYNAIIPYNGDSRY